MAYKFPNKGTTTYVRSIAWQIGSTGKLTPVLNVDPVEFEGATVCRCTAHNLSFVLGNRESEEIAPAIGIGSQIRLERAFQSAVRCITPKMYSRLNILLYVPFAIPLHMWMVWTYAAAMQTVRCS